MTPEMIQAYVDKNYKADRMVLVGVGSIEHADLVKLAETHFGQVPQSVTRGVPAPSNKPYWLGSQLIHRNDEMGPLAHFAIGYEGVSWTSPDSVAFMLMQQLVGTYRRDEMLVPGLLSANRTISDIAWKMVGTGCAENFSAFNTSYKDTGMFGVFCTCDEVAVNHAVGELMFGFGRLSFTVSPEDLARAKKSLKTAIFGGLDTTTAIAEDIGRQILVYGRRMPMAELIARIDAIDAEEIKRVAWKYIYDAEIAVTAIGPCHGILPYYSLRMRTTWFRY
eukprot:Platyproteum_vivax@DN6976_c0_g1_i2.p1